MQNYRDVIKNALEQIDGFNTDFKVKMAFPESKSNGNVISYYELSNTSTYISCVDDIAFQIDLWFMDMESLFYYMEAVDKTFTDIGFLRQFTSPDSMLHDPSGYFRKSLRYGRRVDTRTNRLID